VPSDAYLEALLPKPHFIAVAALAGAEVVGGLAAYELEKFERAQGEVVDGDLTAVVCVTQSLTGGEPGW